MIRFQSRFVSLADVARKCLSEVQNLLRIELALGDDMEDLVTLINNEDIIVFSELQKKWPLKLR